MSRCRNLARAVVLLLLLLLLLLLPLTAAPCANGACNTNAAKTNVPAPKLRDDDCRENGAIVASASRQKHARQHANLR
jgi:hypothetical protein